MVSAIIVGLLLTLYWAKGSGISEEAIYSSIIWAIIFGLLGARAIHILDNLDYYAACPGKIIAFWEGGLAWYGGLIGGVLAVAICARIKGFSLAQFVDAAAPAAILGLAIGRIGCTINGDACGTPTSLPWGIIYTHPDAFIPWGMRGVATHPAPIYEIIWNMVIFTTLWRLKGRIRPEGSMFLSLIAMYSFGRFFISWVRAEPEVLGPLHQAHIISLVLFVVAAALLAYRKTRLVRNI
jgi:phosphatidylglycerol:prolipoprotein diacylglycerol transferase